MSTRPQPAPGRLVRLGVVLPAGTTEQRRRLAAMCELAGIDAVWVRDDGEAADVAAGVHRLDVLVRPAVDEPWARTVPVSIGRTGAEAAARIDGDPTFGGLGDPRRHGLFGTLEECQRVVAALVRDGVVDLRCVLPSVADVHDVIAQLTAVAVGEPGTHRADAPRTPDPPPPDWSAGVRR